MERCQEVEVLGTKENRPGREQEWVDTEPILTPGWGIHGLLLPQRKTPAQQQLRSPRYGKPLACPTFPCLVKSTPLPAHLPPKLSKPLSHQSHLPPGQCRWWAQPEPSGQEEPKPGGWKEKGGCRVQARIVTTAWGWCKSICFVRAET